MNRQKYPLAVYRVDARSVPAIRSHPTMVRHVSTPTAIYAGPQTRQDVERPESAPIVVVYTAPTMQTDTFVNSMLIGVIIAVVIAGALVFAAFIIAGAVAIGPLIG